MNGTAVLMRGLYESPLRHSFVFISIGVDTCCGRPTRFLPTVESNCLRDRTTERLSRRGSIQVVICVGMHVDYRRHLFIVMFTLILQSNLNNELGIDNRRIDFIFFYDGGWEKTERPCLQSLN